MTNAEIIAAHIIPALPADATIAPELDSILQTCMDDARADELAQLLPTAPNGPLRREIERRVYTFARRKAATAPA